MTLGLYRTLVRMAKIKNSGDNIFWRGCGNRGIFLLCWWDYKLVTRLWESVLWFLNKLERIFTVNLATSLLGIYSKVAPTYNKEPCSTIFIAPFLIIARSWKQPRCSSSEERIQKMWYIYTKEYY